MELSAVEQQAIQHGVVVPIFIAETPCVIVRKDVYEKSLADADPRSMYAAVLKAWDADDENPVVVVTRPQCSSWPSEPGTAKDRSFWMAPDFDAPLDDFAEYME